MRWIILPRGRSLLNDQRNWNVSFDPNLFGVLCKDVTTISLTFGIMTFTRTIVNIGKILTTLLPVVCNSLQTHKVTHGTDGSLVCILVEN